MVSVRVDCQSRMACFGVNGGFLVSQKQAVSSCFIDCKLYQSLWVQVFQDVLMYGSTGKLFQHTPQSCRVLLYKTIPKSIPFFGVMLFVFMFRKYPLSSRAYVGQDAVHFGVPLCKGVSDIYSFLHPPDYVSFSSLQIVPNALHGLPQYVLLAVV